MTTVNVTVHGNTITDIINTAHATIRQLTTNETSYTLDHIDITAHIRQGNQIVSWEADVTATLHTPETGQTCIHLWHQTDDPALQECVYCHAIIAAIEAGEDKR